ncbi:hypothetical protein PR202_gb01661 [Eleusine coracana subsp. coracana]|uniref:Uncharacterized protein n=1 Tax=Eleusine coracana subsp. coracana TaxID=191504 RepID=A0AAV5DY00_ELECO|nr:hypothetical protein PR202_gb01661 [Eleusine coracana subsp. coracana]
MTSQSFRGRPSMPVEDGEDLSRQRSPSLGAKIPSRGSALPPPMVSESRSMAALSLLPPRRRNWRRWLGDVSLLASLLGSFILLAAPANVEDPVYTDCPSNTNCTHGSAFQANLDALLSSLPASSVFARNVTGDAPDQVFTVRPRAVPRRR